MVESVTIETDTELDLESSEQSAKWVTKQEFLDSAISTAMKKVSHGRRP